MLTTIGCQYALNGPSSGILAEMDEQASPAQEPVKTLSRMLASKVPKLSARIKEQPMLAYALMPFYVVRRIDQTKALSGWMVFTFSRLRHASEKRFAARRTCSGVMILPFAYVREETVTNHNYITHHVARLKVFEKYNFRKTLGAGFVISLSMQTLLRDCGQRKALSGGR